MVWIIGEYAERIDNADELLESFLEVIPPPSNPLAYSYFALIPLISFALQTPSAMLRALHSRPSRLVCSRSLSTLLGWTLAVVWTSGFRLFQCLSLCSHG
jgi:hypothetical protein